MARPDPAAASDLRPAVEAAYPALAGGRWRRLSGGLVHATFEVEAPGGRYVVQRVHPVFDPIVHEDIEAVTAHLARRGRPTFRLVRTGGGRLWTEVAGAPVRVLTHLAGFSVTRVADPVVARSAGAALGRFHADLADLDHTFRSRRIAHDPPRHAAAMRAAVDAARGHRLYEAAAPLADAIERAADRLPDVSGHPRRVVHGDPKIANLLFVPGEDDPPRPLAWVDLDTCGRQVLAYELGDALRSWCNPVAEDAAEAGFDLARFEAALAGYLAEAPPLSPDEAEGLVVGVEIVALELAARFCKDAVEESYFAWDAERFPASGEHQLARARAQWALARAAADGRGARRRIVAKLLG